VLAHGYGWKENLKFKDFVIARTFRLIPLHVVILVVYIIRIWEIICMSKWFSF